MATICLVMIVKNEERVIERCLRSVIGLIDSWVICDTGSTDSTRERALAALGDVPGTWHDRPWVNFGYNRAEAIGLARGSGDYLFMLDADETVTWTEGVKDKLSADAYLILHQAGLIDYWRRLILRGELPWRYVGLTHEYVYVEGPIREERLAEIVIRCHDDGGARADKFERDVRLLRQELENYPDDPRSTFYLAQTYRALGRTDDALELYRRRVALGGWAEEVFYSLYQIGLLLADGLGDWRRGLSYLLEAWEYRPQRLEPLYDAVARLRQRESYQVAAALVGAGLGVPPPDDYIFVSPWVYDYGLLFEHSIVAYYTGDPQASLRASEELLANPNLPDHFRQHVIRNRALAAEALASPTR